VSGSSRRRDRAWPWLALALIVLVGVVLRAIPLVQGGALFSGIEYDDGVYLSSAALLVGGHLPYADFTLLHPPGIAALLAPLGALIEGGDARTAVIVGRWLMIAIAALTILLVADLGRRWRGWPTGLLAASLYAVSLGALIADTTVLLEPFLNLVCLAALDLWLAGERGPRTAVQALLIGALLMVGLSIKLWAGLYVVVIGGVFLVRGTWRDLAWTIAGGVLAGALLVLPFALAAPADLVAQVLAVQVARPADLTQSSAERLTLLFALGPVGIGGVVVLGVVAAVVVLSLAALVAWRGGTFGAILAALLALMTTMFLLSSSFFDHYPSFLIPIAVLVVGGGTTLLLEMLDGRAPRPVTLVAAGLLVVLLVGIGGVRGVRQATKGPTQPDFGAEIARLVPADDCLVADDPMWILVAGRSPRTAPDQRPTADLFGERVLRATAGGTIRFGSPGEMLLDDASQDVLAGYLSSCPYAVVGEGTDDWMPDRWEAFIAAHRLVADWSAEGGPQLWGPSDAIAS
jgi:alpha-1,2-mannosyltransferase